MNIQAQSSIDEVVLARDLLAEGEPEKEFNAGIAQGLPRKTVAAGALIRDSSDRILFVEPTYKVTLEIPGGITEEDESPHAACGREIVEELGLSIEIGQLLVLDWVPRHGVWRDSLQLIYDGGTLDRDQIDHIELDHDELSGLTFLALDDARRRLRPSLARRVLVALTALAEKQTIYSEFGHRL